MGVLSLLGLAGGSAAALAGWLSPVLLGICVLLLGHAFFAIYIRKHGSRTNIVITWTSAIIVTGFWTWKLLQP